MAIASLAIPLIHGKIRRKSQSVLCLTSQFTRENEGHLEKGIEEKKNCAEEIANEYDVNLQ